MGAVSKVVALLFLPQGIGIGQGICEPPYLNSREPSRTPFCATQQAALSVLQVDVGALKIRTGFGAYYTIMIMKSPKNSIGNYYGPYIIQVVSGCSGLGLFFELREVMLRALGAWAAW